MNWIEKIVPTIGLLIGIAFVAIGSILTGGSILKLALYEPGPASTYSYQCEFKPGSFDTTKSETQLNDAERAECLANAQTDDTIRYRTDKKNTIIDGAMFLIVGVVFWIIFKKWRKAH